MKLTDDFSDVLIVGGREYKINLSYDNVLKTLEMFREDIPEPDKIDIALEMIVGEVPENRIDVFNLIYAQIIGSTEGSGEKVYDLEKDADYIFASFLQDYGIDLIEQQGKMHWHKFKALLNSLSEETKFMKVIGYRTAKIPPENKHNRDQVRHMRKMQRLYALDGQETVEDIEAKWDALADKLKGANK